MESRVPRPCRHGGCRVLTTEGYCEKHKPTANAGCHRQQEAMDTSGENPVSFIWPDIHTVQSVRDRAGESL